MNNILKTVKKLIIDFQIYNSKENRYKYECIYISLAVLDDKLNKV